MTSRVLRGTIAMTVVLGCAWLAASQALAATRYVDDTIPAATDDPLNPCTAPTTPCETIGNALGKASAGDDVLVGGGSYGPFTLAKGVAVRMRDFSGSETDAPAIVSSGISTAITITDPGATVDGFTIRRDMGSPAMSLEAAATVFGNTFDEPVPAAGTEIDISVPFGAGSPAIVRNSFEDPTATSSSQYGIFTTSSGSPEIAGNEFSGLVTGVFTKNGSPSISGNEFTGIENGIGTGFAIDVQDGSATISGILIADHDPGETA